MSDDFFFFKSAINGENYQTNGYMYADNTGHNGPQIWIRKIANDSVYVNVSIEQIATTNPPFTAGNISGYFFLVKKGIGFEGSYSLDKANYAQNYLYPGSSNLMYIDTTANFNFVISDTSYHLPHGPYADGSYGFTLLQNGAKLPATGSFRLLVSP